MGPVHLPRTPNRLALLASVEPPATFRERRPGRRTSAMTERRDNSPLPSSGGGGSAAAGTTEGAGTGAGTRGPPVAGVMNNSARPPPSNSIHPPGALPTGGMSPEMLQAAQMQLLNQWRAAQLQARPAMTAGMAPTAGFRPPPSMAAAASFQAAAMASRPMATAPRPAIPVPVPMSSGGSAGRPAIVPATRPTEALRTSPGASPLLRPPAASGGDVNGASRTPTTAAAMGIATLPIFQHFSAIPPYNPLMSEAQFLESLSRFMALINLPLRKIPHFKDRPIPMHALYRIVTSYGGFHKVSEANRWNVVAASLSFSPITVELLAQLKSFYYTLFFAYEQVFYSRIPLDRVACKEKRGRVTVWTWLFNRTISF